MTNTVPTAPQPPAVRPRVRARRGQATDPHSIAEREAGVKGESNATAVLKSGKRQVKPVDPNPHGEKLLQVEDPLVEATKYLKLLQKHSSTITLWCSLSQLMNQSHTCWIRCRWSGGGSSSGGHRFVAQFSNLMCAAGDFDCRLN
ncbi:transcription factor UNE12-like [Salvia miltiorrhiza]|uniref:transcription factor UNE12-like n=1 Tax=Salvia miltiorrhiza TaxID=226208 RepID=UPI0025ABC0D8|nr:transcription factor UNE12-like [Salvia miltiorrhiza]XP_057764552.1 transcription factor UNE12-like [Salvia miltiorrhiza]